MTRREFAAGLAAGLAAAAGGCRLWGPHANGDPARDPAYDLAHELARLEARSGGRLGVAVHGADARLRAGHRADERFPMCSTFKALACAAVLARVDAGREDLARRVRFTADDLVVYSPATKARAGGDGMTVAELCEAAITLSDNTAGNLILAALGGPPAVTALARSLGDPVTRLDRTEPTLNEAAPDDPRDTTAPGVMAASLHALVIGDRLSRPSRDQLAAWLVASRTGGARLRAGLPNGWRVGDKTGSGERGTANDVAVVWPPGRSPLVVAAFLTGTPAAPAARDATLAGVARAVAAWLAA